MAIDQLLIDFAVLSLDNVRGGPWCRAHQHHWPGVEEINDGTHDGFYVAGYQFLGNSALPAYLDTNQIPGYGFITTTSYRAPLVALEIADRRKRGNYEFKSHHQSVDNKPSPGPVDWDMYYYITPLFSLGSLQNRVEMDNYVNARVDKDFKNTQVWELTFRHPRKILGPTRELRVSTGVGEKHEKNGFVEKQNPNTANMQYKNVLFYKGTVMDYNDNLTDEGGEYLSDTTGANQCDFWHVRTPEGSVFIGNTHCPAVGGGIVEIGTEASHANFDAFQQSIKKAQSSCQDTGLNTFYVSTQGDRIEYNHGTATVNGTPWPLDGYALYESPFVNSKLGSGVIDVSFGKRSLQLDFRNPQQPVRAEYQVE